LTSRWNASAGEATSTKSQMVDEVRKDRFLTAHFSFSLLYVLHSDGACVPSKSTYWRFYIVSYLMQGRSSILREQKFRTAKSNSISCSADSSQNTFPSKATRGMV
jgi:hypothetical protein